MKLTLIKRTVAALAFVMFATNLGAADALAGRTDPPGHRDGNHCVLDTGVDLNALYGVTDQIVARGCTELSPGEHWRRHSFWIVNSAQPGFPPIEYPSGYVPSNPEPIADLMAKLVSIKVVVDGGTRQEKTYTFQPGESVRTDITLDQIEPGELPLPVAVTLPRLAPLSVGEHTNEIIWVLSAQHCDGLGSDPGANCLPTGETSFFGVRPMTVKTPN